MDHNFKMTTIESMVILNCLQQTKPNNMIDAELQERLKARIMSQLTRELTEGAPCSGT